MLFKYAVAALATFALPCALAHADGVTEGRNLARQAGASAEAGDFVKAADLLAEALLLRPNHPGLTYQSAKAEARAGRTDRAIEALANYAAMGLKADLAVEPAFAPFAADPRLTPIRAQLHENGRPKGSVAVEATIAEPKILAEGIVFDSKSQRIYVGSVHKRKIIALDRQSGERDFIATGSHGLFGVFGMTLDAERRSLWASSAAVAQVDGIVTPTDKSRAGMFEFSTVDGSLKRKAVLPDDGKEHVFGDLLRASNGQIFVSDSISPVLYRLTKKGSTPESFVTSDLFHSLQGMALSADERKMAVADYAGGILIVDMVSRAVTPLPMPPRTTLHGIDGLIRHGRDLIGIQNGVDPQRVVRLRMNASWTAVDGLDVLAANLPEMDEPSLATIAGSDLLVIGNAQWARFADDGSIKGNEPFAPTRIVRMALPPMRP